MPTAPNVWCNVDIARYFPSIRRAILGEQLRRYGSDPALLGVLERIPSASPSDTGVGIPKGPVNFGYHRDHVFSFLPGVIFSPVGSSALAGTGGRSDLCGGVRRGEDDGPRGKERLKKLKHSPAETQAPVFRCCLQNLSR